MNHPVVLLTTVASLSFGVSASAQSLSKILEQARHAQKLLEQSVPVSPKADPDRAPTQKPADDPSLIGTETSAHRDTTPKPSSRPPVLAGDPTVVNTGTQCQPATSGWYGAARLKSAELIGGVPAGMGQFQVAYYRGKSIPFHIRVTYEVTANAQYAYMIQINDFATGAVAGKQKAVRNLPDMSGRKDVRAEAGQPLEVTWVVVFPEGTTMPDTFSFGLRGSLLTFSAPDSQSPRGRKDVKIDFDNVPASCFTDSSRTTGKPLPSAEGRFSAKTQPSELLRSLKDGGAQDLPAGKDSVSSPRYAWQVGMSWALGRGVAADYLQATIWFAEALRRKEALGDYSSQTDIRTALSEMSNNDIQHLLKEGQRAGGSGQWEIARFYFGRAALLGDSQAMASLGYSYSKEGTNNPAMERYWCLKSLAGARKTGSQHELDTVNHFCPTRILNSAMTPDEIQRNKASIIRADRESSAIKADMQANAAFAQAMMKAMAEPSSDVGRPQPQMENVYDANNNFVRSQINGGTMSRGEHN